MPNYFKFTRPGSTEPASLIDVEREFIEALYGPDEPIHDDYWHPTFDALQWLVAMVGNDAEQIDRFIAEQDPEKVPAHFGATVRAFTLGERFTASAWYMPNMPR